MIEAYHINNINKHLMCVVWYDPMYMCPVCRQTRLSFVMSWQFDIAHPKARYRKALVKCKSRFVWKIIHAISDSATPFVSLMTDFSVHKHKFSSARDTRGNPPRALPTTNTDFHFQYPLAYQTISSGPNIKTQCCIDTLKNKVVAENCKLVLQPLFEIKTKKFSRFCSFSLHIWQLNYQLYLKITFSIKLLKTHFTQFYKKTDV